MSKWDNRLYAYYVGERLMSIGTRNEIMLSCNMDIKYFKQYRTNVGKLEQPAFVSRFKTIVYIGYIDE